MEGRGTRGTGDGDRSSRQQAEYKKLVIGNHVLLLLSLSLSSKRPLSRKNRKMISVRIKKLGKLVMCLKFRTRHAFNNVKPKDWYFVWGGGPCDFSGLF